MEKLQKLGKAEKEFVMTLRTVAGRCISHVMYTHVSYDEVVGIFVLAITGAPHFVILTVILTLHDSACAYCRHGRLLSYIAPRKCSYSRHPLESDAAQVLQARPDSGGSSHIPEGLQQGHVRNPCAEVQQCASQQSELQRRVDLCTIQ